MPGWAAAEPHGVTAKAISVPSPAPARIGRGHANWGSGSDPHAAQELFKDHCSGLTWGQKLQC